MEISFQAKFLQKATNFVKIRLRYFCTILYMNLHRLLSVEMIITCVPEKP